MHWLQRCVSEVETGKWIIPALKHFREVASLYPEVCTCVHVCCMCVCVHSHVHDCDLCLCVPTSSLLLPLNTAHLPSLSPPSSSSTHKVMTSTTAQRSCSTLTGSSASWRWSSNRWRSTWTLSRQPRAVRTHTNIRTHNSQCGSLSCWQIIC